MGRQYFQDDNRWQHYQSFYRCPNHQSKITSETLYDFRNIVWIKSRIQKIWLMQHSFSVYIHVFLFISNSRCKNVLKNLFFFVPWALYSSERYHVFWTMMGAVYNSVRPGMFYTTRFWRQWSSSIISITERLTIDFCRIVKLNHRGRKIWGKNLNYPNWSIKLLIWSWGVRANQL